MNIEIIKMELQGKEFQIKHYRTKMVKMFKYNNKIILEIFDKDSMGQLIFETATVLELSQNIENLKKYSEGIESFEHLFSNIALKNCYFIKSNEIKEETYFVCEIISDLEKIEKNYSFVTVDKNNKNLYKKITKKEYDDFAKCGCRVRIMFGGNNKKEINIEKDKIKNNKLLDAYQAYLRMIDTDADLIEIYDGTTPWDNEPCNVFWVFVSAYENDNKLFFKKGELKLIFKRKNYLKYIEEHRVFDYIMSECKYKKETLTDFLYNWEEKFVFNGFEHLDIRIKSSINEIILGSQYNNVFFGKDERF